MEEKGKERDESHRAGPPQGILLDSPLATSVVCDKQHQCPLRDTENRTFFSRLTPDPLSIRAYTLTRRRVGS